MKVIKVGILVLYIIVVTLIIAYGALFLIGVIPHTVSLALVVFIALCVLALGLITLFEWLTERR